MSLSRNVKSIFSHYFPGPFYEPAEYFKCFILWLTFELIRSCSTPAECDFCELSSSDLLAVELGPFCSGGLTVGMDK